MSHKQQTLMQHPGATCKKEGTLYVVRNADGFILTARVDCSNAWQAAGRLPRMRSLFTAGLKVEP